MRTSPAERLRGWTGSDAAAWVAYAEGRDDERERWHRHALLAGLAGGFLLALAIPRR